MRSNDPPLQQTRLGRVEMAANTLDRRLSTQLGSDRPHVQYVSTRRDTTAHLAKIASKRTGRVLFDGTQWRNVRQPQRSFQCS